MVSKHHILSIVFALSAFVIYGQEENVDAPEIDSLKTNLKKDGLVIVDTMSVRKRRINPLAPAKAGFYSAVLPGLGQIYNKKYWKAPIVWAAIGGGIYAYTFYDNQYTELRTDFKRRKVGLPFLNPRLSETITDERLEREQNQSQNRRDQWLLISILLYGLNVVDANVDAHLKQFNIDEDLSLNMDFHPYMEVNPITTNPHYGMVLVVKF